MFVDGTEAPSLLAGNCFGSSDVFGSSYRHLHTDWRTSRYKFSQMERKVKMPLQPGRGLMDWIRLGQENPNMGTPDGKPRRVTDVDMAEHSDQDNAWTIINGKVYNVAPYMEYHPGGIEQLMRVAGTDGTKLFNEKHPWVNYESMLRSCFVGHFVGSSAKLKKPGKDPAASKTTLGVPFSSSNSLTLPSPIQYPRTLVDLGISCSWKEDGDSVQLLLDSPWKTMTIEQTIVECLNWRKLRVVCRIADLPPEITWTLPFEMDPLSLKTTMSDTTAGRLSISFQKQDPAILWPEFLQHCVVSSYKGRKFRLCRVRSIDSVTHDTRLFSIDLPVGDSLPIPVGSHVFIRLAQDVERPYTPVMASISLPPNGVPSTTIHLLIKMYPQGVLTPILWALKEGDAVEMSDHTGSFNLNKFLDHSHIFLLAAGTGFTPMARIIQHCLHKLKKRVTLLFFNKTEKDILWRDDLEKIAEQSDQFRLVNVLSDSYEAWQGRKGRVSVELLREFLFPKSPSNYVCVCGPNGFVEKCLMCLKEMEYDDDAVHVFQG